MSANCVIMKMITLFSIALFTKCFTEYKKTTKIYKRQSMREARTKLDCQSCLFEDDTKSIQKTKTMNTKTNTLK